MSTRRQLAALAATLAIAVTVITVGTLSASAATPACASHCISVFSRELGTSAQPNFVEDIFGGEARIGQPVGLKRASNSDTSEDIIPLGFGSTVSDFYAAGMVSAAVYGNYSTLPAVQQEYAPGGVPSGMCVGLASVAYQTEGLTLQPCSVPGTTVWIVDRNLSPTTPGYFPIINGSTTDFSHPFAMDLPQDEIASAEQPLQMQVRRLQFLTDQKALPDRQLWGVHPGVLN